MRMKSKEKQTGFNHNPTIGELKKSEEFEALLDEALKSSYMISYQQPFTKN